MSEKISIVFEFVHFNPTTHLKFRSKIKVGKIINPKIIKDVYSELSAIKLKTASPKDSSPG